MIFGAGGIAESAQGDLAIIDTSTIDRLEAIAIHDQLASRGITYADCPISGLPFRATDGTLTLMFGGSKPCLIGPSPSLMPWANLSSIAAKAALAR